MLTLTKRVAQPFHQVCVVQSKEVLCLQQLVCPLSQHILISILLVNPKIEVSKKKKLTLAGVIEFWSTMNKKFAPWIFSRTTHWSRITGLGISPSSLLLEHIFSYDWNITKTRGKRNGGKEKEGEKKRKRKKNVFLFFHKAPSPWRNFMSSAWQARVRGCVSPRIL